MLQLSIFMHLSFIYASIISNFNWWIFYTQSETCIVIFRSYVQFIWIIRRYIPAIAHNIFLNDVDTDSFVYHSIEKKITYEKEPNVMKLLFWIAFSWKLIGSYRLKKKNNEMTILTTRITLEFTWKQLK